MPERARAAEVFQFKLLNVKRLYHQYLTEELSLINIFYIFFDFGLLHLMNHEIIWMETRKKNALARISHFQP
jgi:hypothetical protein